MTESGPNIEEIRKSRDRLATQTDHKPLIRSPGIEAELGGDTKVFAKCEFLQRTGTFKARGALATLYDLTAEQQQAGVTAVSAGNHAIATAFAAQAVCTNAKVVMISTANPVRVEAGRSYGAEVALVDDVHRAFEVAERIPRAEGRFFVRPVE